MQAIHLREIGPFYDDNIGSVWYRCCDFCYESATEDIWAGKLQESEWRAFYRLEPDGLNVCEHCLPKIDL